MRMPTNREVIQGEVGKEFPAEGATITDAYKPITLEGLAKLNEHDEVGKVLDWLTQSGEIRDYDDEIANRIEDAKTIVRGVVALAAVTPLIRAAALEEAARVAEDCEMNSNEEVDAQLQIAATIRALKADALPPSDNSA